MANVTKTTRIQAIAELQKRKTEIQNRLQNGQSQDSTTIGGNSFTEDEWKKIIQKMDEYLTEVKQEQKERFEKRDKEKEIQQFYEKMKMAEQYKKQVASKPEAPRRANTIAGEAGANDSVALGASAEGGDAVANGSPGMPNATAVAATGPALSPPAAEPAALAAEAPILQFKVSQDSWIQVKSADGKVVFEKTLKAGSEQGITAQPPLKVVVGNALGAELQLRGAAFDLKKVTKGSTARFEVN